MESIYYLRTDVALEPLVDSWYAWPHLISPATAAMNAVGRHEKIMDSFLRAPEAHIAAVQNPAMLGGPFIDLPLNKIELIQNLKKKFQNHRQIQIEFVQAIKLLNELLSNKAEGFSLEELYSLVPEILKGYVELVYDLNHRANFRLIEPLLYESSLYLPHAQSIVLETMVEDDRPFILSTPFVDLENKISLEIEFKDEFIDKFFDLRNNPRSLSAILDMLPCSLEQEKIQILKSFLTECKLPSKKTPLDNCIRWKYYGHACVLIETASANILIDPVLSYGGIKGIERFTFDDLPEQIDYVLITHNHQDHVVLESLLQLRKRIKCLIVPKSNGGSLQDPSLKLMLNKIGFKNVLEINELENIVISTNPSIEIIGIPFIGEHSDLDIRSKITYLVKIDNYKIMFAADTRNMEPMLYKHISKYVGNIDILFLGMECDGAPLSWLYGPLYTTPLNRAMDHSRRLSGSDYEKALELVDCFNSKEVYIYAMGQEPWLNYIMAIKYNEQSNPIIESNKLIKICTEKGIIAERLYGKKEKIIEL